VASITANAADNVGRVVLLLRAIILAMANLTTVLARLVLVITKGTVQGSELAKLVTLELVLAFWNGCSLLLVKVRQLEVEGRRD
jgi:hypothetical protein